MIGSMNTAPVRTASRQLPTAATIDARASEAPAGTPDAPSEGLSLTSKAVLATATLATAGLGSMAMAAPAHAGGYRHGYGGGWGHQHHRRGGGDVGGFIAGAIIGGIISGAINAQQNNGQVYYPPNYSPGPSGNYSTGAHYDNYGQLICTNNYSGNWYASPDNMSCPY